MGSDAAVPRPYVLLSCAISADGFIDDTRPQRLLLSNAEDFDRVDAVRAGCDAILIGATTLRRDNPRLLVNSPARRGERVARGWPANPLKVTVTASGDLDPAWKFWHHGDGKIAYTTDGAAPKLRERLAGLAEVVAVGAEMDLRILLADLARRGVRRLMVEGGGTIHTQFLTAGLADELQLAVAPFFVGDAAAPRWVDSGDFPHGPDARMRLVEVRPVGDVALLRYLLTTTTP